jgi:hypothetical protein
MTPMSRRTLILSLATFLATVPTSANSDAVLEHLYAEFDLLLCGRSELPLSLLETMEKLATQIEQTPATDLTGFRVKARIAAWALLGDLEASQDSGLADVMMRSIVRDLIRNFDPDCETQDAVQRLVHSVTN